MRYMIIVEANAESEASVLPTEFKDLPGNGRPASS
jgi:hypothetical protein